MNSHKRVTLFSLIAIMIMLAAAGVHALDLPYEEDFEGDTHSFEIPDQSSWGVGESHEDWTTFNGLKHLDNNITGDAQNRSHDRYGKYSAGMGDWNTLPKEGEAPYLSYWYRSNLFYGDKISVDVHYYGYYPHHYFVKHFQHHYDYHSRHCYWKKKKAKKKHLKIRTLKSYTWWKNTGAFHKWEKISLKHFKGKEIKVVFRQRVGKSHRNKIFTVDDFRITRLPSGDADEDGIPDEYDPTPNGELIVPVQNFQVENDGGMFVHIKWSPIENEPSLVGYRIYREVKGGTKRRGGRHWYYDNMLNDGKLIDPDRFDFYDTDVDNHTTYTYKIVGVSKEGHDGQPVSADISVELINKPFPFEESFDSVDPGFIIPEDSNWGIVKDHGDWTSYSGKYHLDSNPDEEEYRWMRWDYCRVKAMMKYRIKVPEDVPSPILSYWYKRTKGHYSNKLIIDIHYIKKYRNGKEREKVRTYIRPYKPWNGINEYAWDSISLRKYRGKEIWVTFSQWFLRPNHVNMFVIDDFRISQPSGDDQNGNGIPDEYETPMNSDMLPFVEDFFVTADNIGAAELSWLPLESQTVPEVAGYNVYRYEAGSQVPPTKLNTDPVPKDASSYTDLTVQHDTSYFYFIRAVSTANIEGYPTKEEFIHIQIKPPVINTHPSDVTSLEREEAVFTVSATGLDLQYQWQKDGVDIPGANENTYTISSVALADNATTYQCVVTNPAGSITSNSATLTVELAPPLITKHPIDLTVTEFDTAEFTIQVIGSFVSFQWQKNQVDIPGATDAVYTIAETPLSDNNARFRCIVKNDAGTVTSKEVTLTVNLAPPLIKKHPDNATILEREIAQFYINVRGSLLTYQWQRDGLDIPGANQSIYIIQNAQLSDNNATFTCIVKNDAGTVTSNPATLTVNLAPPLITGHPADLTVTEFNPVEFEVQFIGSFVSFQWQKNQVDIPGATDATLLINEARYADNLAQYRCKVYNDAGTLFSNAATLTVIMVPPEILTHPSDITVPINEKAEFSVTVKGSELSYQWLRFGAEIDGATSDIYTIEHTDISDNNAVYQCIVTNAAGTAESNTAKLTVVDETPPELTLSVSSQQSTSEDFTVVTGMTSDTGSGIASVETLSDQYPGQSFGAALEADGSFSVQVPLKIGENQLTVIAKDVAGNQAEAVLTISVKISEIPRILITSPVNGATVTDSPIDVIGLVRSSIEPDKIRLILNNQVIFPQGTDNEYSFTFEDIHLNPGLNILNIKAETPSGNVAVQTGVNYQKDPITPEETEPPEVRIQAAASEIYINSDIVHVSGTAHSKYGITSVMINGQTVDTTGDTTDVSFDMELSFPTGDDKLDIEVIATDVNNKSTTVSYTVRKDMTNPDISITSPVLIDSPTVNSFLETPLIVKGMVTDKFLAGFTINDQSIGLVPSGTENEYIFEAGINLERGQEKTFDLEAWDHAGNMTTRNLIIRLDSTLDIEIISPQKNSTLMTADQTLDIEITARINGISPTDKVTVTIDGQNTTVLPITGNNAHGTINIQAVDGKHQLKLWVENESGSQLASTTTEFNVTNTANIPLKLERQEPANNEDNIEPNQFIAFYFNRPIDPQLLEVKVYETVHGLNYQPSERGADLTQVSEVKLIEIHKDRENVNGGMAYFPGNIMAAFYPEMKFSYGGRIFVEVFYDSNELSRSSFTIRPLPTFVTGFVTNQFMKPVIGIEVTIPKLGKTATTNQDGNYGFGFGESPEKMIPPGRYKVIVNMGMKNLTYGTAEKWINVEKERINSIDALMVPTIDPKRPFRHIQSNQSQPAVLAEGDLVIDLSQTELLFHDGREQGDIYINFMTTEQITYPSIPAAIPHWVFGIQPMGIEVVGEIGITLKIPAMYGSHDYVEALGERVIMIGFDPDAMQLVPVGVGLVDQNSNTVTSVGKLELKRLDIIGYAVAPYAMKKTLEQYANGEVGLEQVIGELQSIQ